MNIFTKVINWGSTKLTEWRFRQEEKQLLKELSEPVAYVPTMQYYHEDMAQAAIAEGVTRIKNKLQYATENGKLEQQLEHAEIVTLAENESKESKARAELLKTLYVKPEVNQDQMINQRINHYYQLQQHKVEREQRRKMRGKSQNGLK